MTQDWPPEAVSSDTAVPPTGTATAPTSAEITATDCRQCGAKVSGLNGRYACAYCGWVNHWSEGSNTLPGAEDDPDYPGP